MQSMGANKRRIYYSILTGYEDILDTNLKKTGDKRKNYSTPTAYDINYSYERGTVNRTAYGIDYDYSRAMVTNDMNCPIQEDTMLWIEASTSSKPDYIVTRKSVSVNSISYEIKEVDQT